MYTYFYWITVASIALLMLLLLLFWLCYFPFWFWRAVDTIIATVVPTAFAVVIDNMFFFSLRQILLLSLFYCCYSDGTTVTTNCFPYISNTLGKGETYIIFTRSLLALFSCKDITQLMYFGYAGHHYWKCACIYHLILPYQVASTERNVVISDT